ncbi:MAG: L,D-transpeptidase [Anaerolineales bacterium]|nr:L,D-transpeptidase [Anaerolineales bacterium]
MKQSPSRRDFLRLGYLALGSLALTSFAPRLTVVEDFTPGGPDYQYPTGIFGRVTRDITIFEQPLWRDGVEVGYLHANDMVNIYYELTPLSGPPYNPLWYRIWGGYIHSANVQRVKVRFNTPVTELPRLHNIGEVTVPYTQAWKKDPYFGWQPFTFIDRFYYLSVHWVVGIDEGPDGEPWYRLHDELRKDEYHVPATHIRLVPDEELAPISPDVPPEDKRIEISLQEQTLTAYEANQVIFHTRVSTGLDYRPPDHYGMAWNTPTGRYNVKSKYPSKHMGDGNLAGDYDLPGVPWTIFFTESGHALHGTYWHNDFGIQRSHGCVNLRTEESKWLFRWTTPAFKLDNDTGRYAYTTGNGTLINIT